MNHKLLILGTLPPPVGGVTIHTKRLLKMLDEKDIDYSFWDIREKKGGKFSIMKYFQKLCILLFLNRKYNVLHYQLNNWLEAMFVCFLAGTKRRKILFTVHSFTDYPWKRKIYNFAFLFCRKRVFRFIAPSETVKNTLIKYGIKEEKIIVISTFIPPTHDEINMRLPKVLHDYFQTDKSVVLANAYKLYLDSDKNDVYGLDLCMEACKQITDIKFLFCCPIIGNQDYYKSCIQKLKNMQLEERFLIYNETISLVSLLQYCKIFVRPTLTDSYGISIEEALSMGIPAIASDVCERTKGTILFQKGNLNDFIDKIENVLQGKFGCGYKASNYKKIIRLYDSMLSV